MTIKHNFEYNAKILVIKNKTPIKCSNKTWFTFIGSYLIVYSKKKYFKKTTLKIKFCEMCESQNNLQRKILFKAIHSHLTQ